MAQNFLISDFLLARNRGLMRYSLHEIDRHDVLATTVAADRDEALEWFSEKLRLMLTFEGDPVAADYALDHDGTSRGSIGRLAVV